MLFSNLCSKKIEEMICLKATQIFQFAIDIISNGVIRVEEVSITSSLVLVLFVLFILFLFSTKHTYIRMKKIDFIIATFFQFFFIWLVETLIITWFPRE